MSLRIYGFVKWVFGVLCVTMLVALPSAERLLHDTPRLPLPSTVMLPVQS